MALEKITEAGLKALKNDTQLSDEIRLLLELVARFPEGFEEEDVAVLEEELVDIYGSPGEALAALKSGKAQIKFDGT